MSRLNFFLIIIYIFLFSVSVSACDRMLSADEADDIYYWNLDSSLEVTLEGEYTWNDRFDICATDGSNQYELAGWIDSKNSSNATLKISVSRAEALENGNAYTLTVRKEGSVLNDGAFYLVIDQDPPEIEFLAGSPDIQRGGSALAAFKVTDDNFDYALISDNYGMEYRAQEYYTEGYYVGLCAWYVKQNSYSAEIYAYDKAGNYSSIEWDLPTAELDIERSYLSFKPSYTEDKTEELEIETNLEGLSSSEQYALVNSAMAARTTVTLWETTSIPPTNRIHRFEWEPFEPIPDARISSSYGRLRLYYYQSVLQKSSYHTGIDFSRNVNDPILASNPGEVVYAYYNSGYGNTLAIYHGLGLYSMYAHCSELNFEVGEFVEAGDTVAYTGSSGVATGDHLHFGIYIQGMPSNPGLWMDADWMQSHIYDVLDNTYEMIKEDLSINSNQGEEG